MIRFLHLADIHLGFDRYDTPERTKDFFYAFNDVIERYAIADPVDFVVIAGDLFEHRSIQPNILNQAQVVLRTLKNANIPVLAIEGNHDNRPYGVVTSWLRYLCDWDLLILLEPEETSDGRIQYTPWDGRRGGYIDLDCGVRVIGSQWYGASAPIAIARLAEAIAALPSSSNHNLLLFHHGLEGQIARYKGALRYEDLRPLRQAGIDYLALGHIHRSYSMDNWLFNPGSLEANSVEEAQYERGCYRVTIDDRGIQATLHQDYQQRAIVRLRLTTHGNELIEDLTQLACQTVEEAIAKGSLRPDDQPIVELKIVGNVGFNRLDLDVRALQQQLKTMSNALVFLLKFDAIPLAYGIRHSPDSDRRHIEREIYLDLCHAHSSYKDQAEFLADALVELKQAQLEGASEAVLYEKLLPFCDPEGAIVASTEQTDPEPTVNEQAVLEQAATEQAVCEQAVTDQTDPHRNPPELEA